MRFRSLQAFATLLLLAAIAAGGGRNPAPAPPAATPAASPRMAASLGAGALPEDAGGGGERVAPAVGGTFAIPVAGGVLPNDRMLLPGSAREYRGGFHEGIDFPARVGTQVHAAAPGIVTRVDYAFRDWSEPARNAALDNARRLGYTPEIVLDLIRGQQVWIDHGGGVVTRYAHLSSVAPLMRGDAVDATTVIGYVGSTGYPEGGPHLHFEIRLGDSYLGAGLDATAVRQAVARAFGG